MTGTTQPSSAACLAALSISLVSSCALYGLGEIYCRTDQNCPSGYICGANGVCQGERPWTPPWISPDVDAGAGSDGGTTSGCEAARCSTMPDSATSYCSDGQGVDCANLDSRFHGQDGQYLDPVPEYSRVADGVIQDKLTGLLWRQRPAADPLSFDDAEQYCEGLDPVEDPWRVPSYRELMTLFDYGRGADSVQAAMDSNFFPGKYGTVWSSTRAWTESRWGFNDYGLPSSLSNQDTHAVRCVSGAATASSALTEHEWGLLDQGTGLVWRQQSEGPFTWQSALAHCFELGAGAEDDWRLPSVKELETTVDRARADAPLIREPLQPRCDYDYGCPYWSSTPLHGSTWVWYLDFDSGTVDADSIGKQYLVRCVRGPI